ncbi:MAG: hypothetical protein NVSMB1_13580 [Polyangiales bacterium]
MLLVKHAFPTGTVARLPAQSEGLGGTVGATLGQVMTPLTRDGMVLADDQLVPKQPRTSLQRGSRSSPYSQRRPSFVQAPSAPASVAGQSGCLGPRPVSGVNEASEPVLEEETVLPPHETKVIPTTANPARQPKRDAASECMRAVRQLACRAPTRKSPHLHALEVGQRVPPNDVNGVIRANALHDQ